MTEPSNARSSAPIPSPQKNEVGLIRAPRCFELYRRKPPEAHTTGGDANAPEEVQLQGVVFADGTVATRWLTPPRSTCVWPDFDTFDKVPGHREYESELRWLDA